MGHLARHILQEVTRGSCVVGWVQLDNQTQEPVAPVVVAPTIVKHPQATLQMSFIRNNVKSHSHLNHFEVGWEAAWGGGRYVVSRGVVFSTCGFSRR